MKARLVTVAVLFVASAFGAYYLGIVAAQYASNTPPPVPHEAVIDGLAVELPSLDLGEVPEQADYPCQFAIQNRNNAPVEIFDIAVSCSCVEEVEPRNLKLEPGASASVRLKLNLAKRNYSEQP
jgi:hypothetical protein